MIKKAFIAFLLLSSLAYYLYAQKIEPVWGKQYIIGQNNDLYPSIASDAAGNIYTWLNFKDTIKLGNNPIIAPSTGASVLIKFNTRGDLLWEKFFKKSLTGINSYSSGTIGTLNDSLFLVYGSYADLFEVKPGLTLDTFKSASERKHYLMCLNTSGEVLWARATQSRITIDYLHANASGFFVKGSTDWAAEDSVDVFGVKIPITSYFIIHFDFNGNAIQMHSDLQYSLNSYHSNIRNDLVCAAFLDFNVDSFPLDTMMLHKTIPNRGALFLIKRKGFGQVMWYREFQALKINNYYYLDYALTTDKDQNIYIAFDYRDSFVYDTITYYGLSSTKIAIVKISPNGKLLWINTSESSLDGFYESVRKLRWENNQLTLYAIMHSASVFDSFTFPTAEPQQTQIIRFDTATGKVTDAFGLWLVAAYEDSKGPGLSYYQFAPLIANPLLTIKGYHFTRINHDGVLVKLDTLTWWKALPENSFTQLQVYPNPVNNTLYVSLAAHKSAFQLQILDLNGRLMQTIEVAPNEQEIFIDTGRLPKGFYILHAQSPGGKHSFARFTRM